MMATLHIGSLCVSGLFLALAWLLWKYAPEVTDRPGNPASHSRFSVRLWAVCRIKPLFICYGVERRGRLFAPKAVNNVIFCFIFSSFTSDSVQARFLASMTGAGTFLLCSKVQPY